MASVYENAVNVISKPPEERNVKEIRPLIFWFRKKSDIFRELTTDVVQDIVRNCDFQKSKRDDIIIKQGEKGDCFYIILRGVVSIHINTDLGNEDDDGDKYTTPQVIYHEDGELDRTKFGNYIAKLETGFSFGELALINKNCIRNASIIADEDTDLLVVNRELYNRSLKAAQTLDLEQRNEFVRNHIFFSNWAFRHRKQMSYSLKKEKIQFNEYIVKQGQTANALYFLLKGQAKVVMEPLQHESQYSQFYPLQDPQDILIQEEMSMNDGMPVRHIRKEIPAELLPENQINFPPSALRRKEKPKKCVEISVVAGPEVIGDIEFALELKTFLQSVICSQECEVYTLTIKNYERLVTRRNPKTVDLLRENAQMKLSARLKRLHDNQVPLMRTLLFKLDRIDRGKNRWKFPSNSNLNSSSGADEVFSSFNKPVKADINRLSKPSNNAFFSRSLTINVNDKPAIGNFKSLSQIFEDKDETDSPPSVLKRPKSRRRKKNKNEYEDNDTWLTGLEERIKGWHASVQEVKQTVPGRKDTLNTVPLRRWCSEGKLIFPPSKVVIRKRGDLQTTIKDIKNEKGNADKRIFNGGIQEVKAQNDQKGENQESLHRNLLSHHKEPQPAMKYTNKKQETNNLLSTDASTYNSPINANKNNPTSSTKANPAILGSINEETGTILDVIKRSHEHSEAQLKAMAQLTACHKNRKIMAHLENVHHNQNIARSNSFTLPFNNKRPLPEVTDELDRPLSRIYSG